MDYNDWLANWQREADRLFRLYEALPPELQPSIQQLHIWGGEARLAAEKIEHIRQQLREWRLERQAAEKRIAAIAEKQRLQTEMEIAEREYQKWKKRLELIKADIERVTSQIILEMRRRTQERLEKQAAQDKLVPAQLQADLQLWESFKIQLDEPQPTAATVDDLIQQREERERLRQEYESYQQRSTPSEDENAEAWAEFTQEIKPGKKKR